MQFIDLKLRGHARKYAQQLDSLRQIYDEIKFDTIFEPVVIRDSSEREVTLIGTTYMDLTAWQKEIGYGCIAKMKLVEESIISLLSQRELYSVAILIRHHMELSGLLALSLEVLLNSLKERDIEILNKFMAKTLYGSSFANNPLLRDGSLAFGMSKTVTVSAMIRALDNFYTANLEEAPNTPLFVNNYAVLCQIAHPSTISSSLFTTCKKVEKGHVIDFQWEPDYGKDAVKSSLAILRDSLMIGLACFHILTSYEFLADGSVLPDEDKVKYAFFKILNRFN